MLINYVWLRRSKLLQETKHSVLNLTNKFHTSIYNGATKPPFKDYVVDFEDLHAFITTFIFKSKKCQLTDEGAGKLDIPTEWMNLAGNPKYKFLVNHHGEFSLLVLKCTSLRTLVWSLVHYKINTTPFTSALLSLSHEGQIKILNCK